MDKDLEKKVKELGAIERAYDSEEFRKSGDLARSVIMEEDYLDAVIKLNDLKKALKRWRIVLISEIIIFIILLLYMVYTVANRPVEVKPKPETEIEVEQPVITQHIVNKNLIFALDVPSFDDISISSYKIGDLLEDESAVNLADGCIYGNYGEDGWMCVMGKSHQHELDQGVAVYKVSDLESALASTSKNYNFVDSLPVASDDSKEMLVGYISGDDGSVAIYNSDIASMSNVQESDLIAKVDTTEFNFTFYEQVNEDQIKDVISSAFNTGGYNVNFSDEATVKDAIANVLSQLKELDVKMAYNYGDLSYDYYDSVRTDGDVKVYTKSGVDEVPEYIYNYTVTNAEVVYNTLACAYYYNF